MKFSRGIPENCIFNAIHLIHDDIMDLHYFIASCPIKVHIRKTKCNTQNLSICTSI